MRPLKTALPTLNALAVFESAARHCNLTRCAEEIRVSQSAVSRHISNLEHQIGFVLFNRNGKKLQLTLAGRRLADAVGFGLGHINDVLTSLRREAVPGRVTIACSYDIAMLWLVPRFSALRNAMPGIEFRLLTSDAYSEFDAPEIDLSVRFGTGPWAGMKHVPLFNEEVFPVCAPSLLTRLPRLAKSPEAIESAPLIHYKRSPNDGLGWREWFAALGLPSPQVAHSSVFSSYIFVLESAVAGNGVALCWKGFLEAHLNAGVLRKLPGDSLHSKDGFHVVYPESRGQGVVPAVANWLKASCTESYRPLLTLA
jgi:LysR family transcriptional regulator, glycine cleavage system transcriptional activator